MAENEYTPLEEIPKIRDTLRATYRSGLTKPLAWRRHQLLQLARMMKENAEELAASLHADLGRPKFESYVQEVCVILDRALNCARNLEKWAKPQPADDVPDWQKSWNPTVHKAPKGIALLIAPWNYPLILTLQPLYGAISAGCCAVIKPSEIAPHYASLLARLFPKYMDQSAYRVVLGAIPEITRLLELQWDHIFYTGNGRVARIIATAAAKHLTPITLELGGKSPVIIDSTCDISLAAKHTLWGKINNAGQLCVVPDFVLVVREKQDELIEAFKKYYRDFYPNGALNSDSYSRIVSKLHHDRLKGLLSRTKGEIVLGGTITDHNLGFEPTIVKNVQDGDSLLEEELFGPILPLIPVDSVDDAIEFINDRDHPLVLYAFTNDPQAKRKSEVHVASITPQNSWWADMRKLVLERTTSGNLAFNDTVMQLSVNEIPFGGVGESGYGRQILRYSFNEFSYDRSVVDVPKEAESSLEIRYPPYTKDKMDVMSAPLVAPIPDSTPTRLVDGGRL